MRTPGIRPPTVSGERCRLRATLASLLLLAVAVSAIAGCSTASSAFPVPREHRVWPHAPARAQVQWIAEYPDESSQRSHSRPLWRALLDWIAGVDDHPQAQQHALARPFGLAAYDGGFVVTDPGSGQVLRVSWPNGRVRKIRCGGLPWTRPMAVAVHEDKTLYVADGGAGRVVRVSANGTCAVIGQGRLRRPTGVAIARHRLFVVDPPNHRLSVFTLSGEQLFDFGFRGDADTLGLNFPTAVCATAKGNLMVVDALNFRIVRYSADGRFIESFGRAGTGPGELARPKAVAQDASGRTYVSDSQRDVVHVFGADMTFEVAIGGAGSGAGDLALPAGVAIDKEWLYVADSYNGRVQIYQLLAEGQ